MLRFLRTTMKKFLLPQLQKPLETYIILIPLRQFKIVNM